MKLRDIIYLMRVRQWYKNLVIFLSIIFASELLNLVGLEKTFYGFLALCFISSVNYIINDIVDIKKDINHPEKRLRPLASGKIKVWQAIILAITLFIVSLGIGISLSGYFLLFILFLFLVTQLYSFFLKKEPFVDIIIIAVNFVVRAASGVFVIMVDGMPWLRLSPWLIICVFFLSLFISIGKREADLVYLGEKAVSHKEVFSFYTKPITKSLMVISTSLLIMSYSLYSFLSINQYLVLTLPFALYVIFRYLYLIEKGSEVTRHPEKVFFDIRMMIGIVLWLASSFLIVYY
ncbi:decaprenyl-phosphate phosphoribosyltransferase [Candidatus Woesearchaeota archaeon]|nr:decaprenyl-phosphate phosphoribosyltransferase [Candidatus Woesearchaeota archaeon]|tara:strand:- start:11223 stop:12095 length:873 start_codon:yes stop_codon:yes gene_type:complete